MKINELKAPIEKKWHSCNKADDTEFSALHRLEEVINQCPSGNEKGHFRMETNFDAKP
jgi:hypothetical protein